MMNRLKAAGSWSLETVIWSVLAFVVFGGGFFALNGCSVITRGEFERAARELTELEAQFYNEMRAKGKELDELEAKHERQLNNEQTALGVLETAATIFGFGGVGGIATAVRRVHKVHGDRNRDRLRAIAKGEEVGKAVGWQDVGLVFAEFKREVPAFAEFLATEQGEKLGALMDAYDERMRPVIAQVKDGGFDANG